MPGPTFTRPPATDTGETTRRQAFDALLDRRDQALRSAREHDAADLISALVRGFVESVERANSSRALLRQRPVEYVDAVVVEGSAGQLVVESIDYDSAPVYWQSRAGEVTSVVHGADLDAYLRTGEKRYAEAIGLR
jgi:hypothetical protein